MNLSNVKTAFKTCKRGMGSECGNLHSAKMEVMNWFLLVVSGCVELVFTYCLSKASKTEGLEKGLWSIGTASAIALSLYIVTKVLKTLPIGTAYAVWTGIGAVGTVIIGIVFFKEPVSFGRLFFIFTLIVSIVGLKVVSS
jgi:quaternary ammonium compound-resistance protein SugE